VKAEGQLLDLAASVADGAQVDWQAAETGTQEQARRLVRQLRLVAEVAELYRSLPDAPQPTFVVDEPTPEGKRWGRLVLLEKIGEGTSSEVYRAWDPELQREVALKLLRADGTEAEAARWRMLGEARRLARVRHPHVVLVYGADRREDRVGLWMEFVDGATLDSLVQKSGLLGAREAALIGVDVCRALAAVHAAGLVHRDIKAQNVMRESGGRIVLMDFGTGEEIHRVEGRAVNQIAARAARGGPRLAGTPLYLAPEILAGGAASARSDLYSLGVLLFYLVTRQFPVAARTFEDLVKAHGEQNVRRLRDLRPDLPDGFVHAVERALAPAPAARYQSAGAMEAALRGSLDATEPALPVTPTPAPTVNAARWRKPAAWVALAAAATLTLTTWLWRRPPSPATPPPVSRIAVLPLADLSGGLAPPYLADALTDQLIVTLGQVKALRVTSRTSVLQFRNTTVPIGEIATKLGVGSVLEGSIAVGPPDSSGSRPLTVNARLIAAGRDTQLWANTFQRPLGAALAVDAEIARAVARAVRVGLDASESERLRGAQTTSPAAADAYFQGRYHLKQTSHQSLRQAIAAFQRAIDLDPGHALAYSGLAQAHIALGAAGGVLQPAARVSAVAAASRALQLDGSLAEAHATVADLQFRYDWDWDGADKSFRRALELNPSLTDALSLYARFLSARGRVDDALVEANRARELDPFSPDAALVVGLMQYYARQYARAAESLHDALALDPEFARAYALLGRVYEAQGRYDEALDVTRRALALTDGGPAGWQSHVPRVQALAGQTESARQGLSDLEARVARDQLRLSPEYLAYVHAALGNHDRALALLEQAVSERDPAVLWFGVDPRLDQYRQHPRFAKLLRQLNNPRQDP
jgi:TolB-like protein/tetratricopeptide (TPR) repeat protein/tRNA A-37 threonylcarbamoyl transferase component Bud32